MKLESAYYLLRNDGKHALYCDGYSHLYQTYWGIGCGSFDKDKCTCNIISKLYRRIKYGKASNQKAD